MVPPEELIDSSKRHQGQTLSAWLTECALDFSQAVDDALGHGGPPSE